MPPAAPLSDAATAGGLLLVLALVVPVVGALLAFVLGGRRVERVAMIAMAAGSVVAVAIAARLLGSGGTLVYHLAGWAPPLGVALRADGPAAAMMLATAFVVCATGWYALPEFRTAPGAAESRTPFAFWILLLGVWAGLNACFITGDLFTAYVALELLTFAAVPLVSLEGKPETIAAALRYLLFALLGSVLYLLGTALLYGAYGTLDIVQLARVVRAEPATWVAGALMTVGLLAKSALVPLHLWLPPAHAGAPAAASAVLSALVVKGSWFLVVRLWFDVMPTVPGAAAMQLLGALGAVAIVFANVVALRQRRLKLLVAYSTLAQIGYLFLMFPLAVDPGSGQLHGGAALSGGVLQAISHATAKAAMFMAAGLIYAALGHDRIAELGGVARVLPVSTLAFALGGLALLGAPPGGAYVAKELLLHAAGETGQWWWALVLDAGGFLTGGYLVLVLAHALTPADRPIAPPAPVPRAREAAALALALCSLSLGLLGGNALLPVPSGVVSDPLTLEALGKVLPPLLGGLVLAILIGGWGDRGPRILLGDALAAMVGPARRAALAASGIVERADVVLRRWPVAGLSLLLVAVLLGAAIAIGSGRSN